MDNRPIGLLDSGVGGFTVVKKVIEKLPHESTVLLVIVPICLMVIKVVNELLNLHAEV